MVEHQLHKGIRLKSEKLTGKIFKRIGNYCKRVAINGFESP